MNAQLPLVAMAWLTSVVFAGIGMTHARNPDLAVWVRVLGGICCAVNALAIVLLAAEAASLLVNS